MQQFRRILLAVATFYYSVLSLSVVVDAFTGVVSAHRWCTSRPIILSPLDATMNKDVLSLATPTYDTAAIQKVTDTVPSTWPQALHRFFLGEIGPPLVVVLIAGFIYTRLQLPIPISLAPELLVFASSVVFWCFQEYAFHRILLHSPFDWIGKSIHQTHHDKDYFHISIDPPVLLVGWLFTAHFILKSMLPWHICLSATIGYAFAGFIYEWSHYIVHTKVKVPRKQSSVIGSFFSNLYNQMRDNHVRHHLVNDQYWYSFSVTAMDDMFNTNPSVKAARVTSSAD